MGPKVAFYIKERVCEKLATAGVANSTLRISGLELQCDRNLKK